MNPPWERCERAGWPHSSGGECDWCDQEYADRHVDRLLAENPVVQAIHARECGCEWGPGNHEQEERRSWSVFARDVLVNLERRSPRD